MVYRITKECGPWWEDSVATALPAWGDSGKQRPLAEKVSLDDVLLHFIDSARAWAGYSTVIGPLRQNDRDDQADWRTALPFVIPIKPVKWLTKPQCELTVGVEGLAGSNHHRQRAFTAMNQSDAQMIIAAIDTASTKSPKETDDFNKKWNRDAEQYYWDIARASSGGKCWLCRTSAESWVAKNEIAIPNNEVAAILERFFDVAHIEARSDSGKMSPDNVRLLCPNCHRIVDRVPKQTRKKLLQDAYDECPHKARSEAP